MKTKILTLAALMLGATMFTACSDDDDNGKGGGVTPPLSEGSGVLVLCTGSFNNSMYGDLTYYNALTKVATQGMFTTANGRSLGMTPNTAKIYGNKLYIVVNGENTVEVVDKTTMKSVKQISLPALMGTQRGISPREIAAADGCIYVTLFGTSGSTGKGSVAVIDTVDFALVRTFDVGSYPEGIAVVDDRVYVANSNYGMGGGSITKYNLTTNTSSLIQNDATNNPVDVVAVGDDVYFLDYGTYDAAWNQVDAGVRRLNANDNVTRVADATAMSVSGNKIYCIYAPWGRAAKTYSCYDITAGTDTPLTFEGAELYYPQAIGADPVTGDIFVASARQDPDTGYTSYTLPGYVNHYKADGSFVTTFDCGADPQVIFFTTAK